MIIEICYPYKIIFYIYFIYNKNMNFYIFSLFLPMIFIFRFKCNNKINSNNTKIIIITQVLIKKDKY